jgi:YD repeat-containing protein
MAANRRPESPQNHSRHLGDGSEFACTRTGIEQRLNALTEGLRSERFRKQIVDDLERESGCVGHEVNLHKFSDTPHDNRDLVTSFKYDGYGRRLNESDIEGGVKTYTLTASMNCARVTTRSRNCVRTITTHWVDWIK